MNLTMDMLNSAIKQMKVEDRHGFKCYISDSEMEAVCKRFGVEYAGQKEQAVRSVRFIVADLNVAIPSIKQGQKNPDEL